MFTDFTIIVEDKEISVHSVILAQSSNVFETAIKSNFKEKQSKSILIEDFHYYIVLNAITFIYMQILLNEHYLFELLQFSDKYNICTLHSYVQQALIKKINLSNLFDLINIAENLNAKQLSATCISFASSNLIYVKQQSYWRTLDDSIARKILG